MVSFLISALLLISAAAAIAAIVDAVRKVVHAAPRIAAELASLESLPARAPRRIRPVANRQMPRRVPARQLAAA